MQRVLNRYALAEYWSLNSDTVSLQSAYAPNRWRLPPSSVVGLCTLNQVDP
jgi:hypothetical protein